MGGIPSGCLRKRKPGTRSNRPKHEFLNDKELIVVRETWVRLRSSDTQSMGIRIFLRIFDLAPDTKNVFTAFRNLSLEELKGNGLFRSHATRFMRAVEVTMNNLDALDVIIVPNLKQLGRKHTEFEGFRPEYLNAFEISMDDIWAEELGRLYTSRARKAWKQIFRLITSKVLEGYQEDDEGYKRPPQIQSQRRLSAEIPTSSSSGQLTCSEDTSPVNPEDKTVLMQTRRLEPRLWNDLEIYSGYSRTIN